MNVVRGPPKLVRSAKRTKTTLAKRKAYTAIPTQVRLGRQPVPRQLFNTLTYVETFTKTVTSGSNVNHQFSCNGMFDPNTTGSGHQPLYFDTFSGIFDHYTVLRSRIRVTWSAINNPNPVFGALYIDDDATTVTTASADSAAERPGAVSRMFLPLAEGTMTLYLSWDAAKTFGPNPQAQDSLQGSSGGNPSEQSFFTMVTNYPALDTLTMVYNVKVDYDVVWDEWITIAQS